MATSNAPQRERSAAQDSVTLDRLDREARAARLEATGRTQPRRHHRLIEMDQAHRAGAPGPADSAIPAGKRLGHLRSSRASSWLTRSASSSWIDPEGTSAARGRAITTRSKGPRPLRALRNHSRTWRLTRFLVTAFPTRRLTVRPRRGCDPRLGVASNTNCRPATRRPVRPTLRKSRDSRRRSAREKRPVEHCTGLLRRGGDRQALPALRATAFEDRTAATRLHPGSKAVDAPAADPAGLVGALHGFGASRISRSGRGSLPVPAWDRVSTSLVRAGPALRARSRRRWAA